VLDDQQLRRLFGTKHFGSTCYAQSLAVTNRVTDQLSWLTIESFHMSCSISWLVLLINDNAFGPRKAPRWKNHPAEEWVCFAVVPNASTSSLAHALAHWLLCSCAEFFTLQ